MAITNGDGSIILTTKVDTSGAKKGLSTIEKLAKGASKAMLALGVAAATATIKIAKSAVDAFAEYEQLVGGVETLFKTSSKKVLEYANEAYKTTGLSANQYMATVTSFSASLLDSLEGDTEKAADIANAALISMSDNANKMGSSMESIQMAFQGFAKQQYMLLDNLKLGYGGTKTEMERLLKDAQAITGVEYNIDNLADVYTAIGVIQEKLGIAGTTAKEAESTISGSAATMKAAWQNVLAAISGGGDLDRAISNLVDSLEKYFENILPVVERALRGIGVLIEKIAPMLVQTVAKSIIKALPDLVTAVYSMIIGLFKGIYQGIVDLIKGDAKKVLDKQAKSIEKSVENQEELTEEVKETEKALKKTLASFDEIQILTAEEDAFEGFEDQIQKIGDGVFDGQLTKEDVVSEVNETLFKIMGIVGFALAAIGIILLCFGQIGWGIGFIIAGAVSLGAANAKLGDAPTQEAQDTMNAIITIASAATLALGVILICFGIITPLSIGLVAAGSVGLATELAINGKKVVGFIKNIWQEVKNFWNNNIKYYFTIDFWEDLADKSGSGLLRGFAKALNLIKDAFQEFRDTASDILGSIVIPFDIGSFSRVGAGSRFKIPKLAQGAVLPANKPFLAMVGDQKQGTNIEAPLQTIVDAFNIALQSNANYGGGNTEVVLEIDGREFGRAVVEQGNRENRRIGTRLVIV